MKGFRSIFQGVDDLHESNAKKRGLTDMLAAALLATLSGWSVMQLVRPVREVQMGISEPILETQGRPAEPSIGHVQLCISPLGRLLPCDQKRRQIRQSASPRSKCRIPEVVSATAPRNP